MTALRPLLVLTLAGLVVQAPAQAAVRQAEAQRSGPDQLSLTWSAKGPVDVYAADRPDAPLKGARLLARGVRAQAYDVDHAGPERRYFVLVDEADHKALPLAERVVPLAQGSNFRDIGGYVGAGGKHVRWGLIYRSAAQAMLSPEDVARIKALKVTQLVDLRSTEERSLAPTRLTGVSYAAVGYSMADLNPPKAGDARDMGGLAQAYRTIPVRIAPQIREIFRDLLAARTPLVYNCSAGQDRTGFATAMILSALGVSRDQIVADYHLSTRYRRPEWEMPPIDAAAHPGDAAAQMFAQYQKLPSYRTPMPLKDAQGRAYLAIAFDEIDARWGSVDGYLKKEIGLSNADIVKLRRLYLE
jgi:protein-tyrosine phosphatase